MHISEFDFNLPKELIAQHPLKQRDESRILIANPKDTSKIEITKFYNIVDFLNKDDVIILNNSKVIKAFLKLSSSPKITINLSNPVNIEDNIWLGFIKPAKKVNKGDIFDFADNNKVLIIDKFDQGEVYVKFILNNISVFEFLDIYGSIPLPPYIKRNENNDISLNDLEKERFDSNYEYNDKNAYQTIYAESEGSVAAPTAGMHFTEKLLDQIAQKGVNIQYITLHVGGGTFIPVKTENVKDHKMHHEYYSVNKNTADAINNAKEKGGRVIAVGTTSVRTLETIADNDGYINPQEGNTNIFITPGYKFKIIDALITNFHLPKSTLFMLVSAFGGLKEMKQIYEHAISQKMRFFSYGDAMLLYSGK